MDYSVLLLDDNKATNFIHTKFLKLTGKVSEINSFQSGPDALAHLKVVPDFPRLIFVDINMPIMDAWEFIEAYRQLEREEKKNSKIIVLTTTISPQDEEKRNHYPEIDSMAHKPLDPRAFDKVLTGLYAV